MKGISHFITGVALATFFPEVVQAAAGGSLLPVLGGIGGILPDTLDFRFARYFERYHDEIDPGPEPDAREIAGRLAEAMRRAYESGEPQHVMLHTIRLGADLWRQYTVRFDPPQSRVAVRIGPIVNTGQVPLPGSEPTSPSAAAGNVGAEAQVDVGVPMVHTYDAENTIDIFSGPSFKFERRGDELYVHFLDWHRRWSHSLTLAVAVGAAAALLVGSTVDWNAGLWGGLVTGLGFAGHVLEDQLGHMGSNLLYPFTKGRTAGLKLFHSGDAIPNFLTVWAAGAVILFNLDRFSAQPRLNPWLFLGLAVALPGMALGGLYRRRQRDGKAGAEESLRQQEIIAETEEVNLG